MAVKQVTKVAHILQQIDYLSVLPNKQFFVEYKRLFVTLPNKQLFVEYKRLFVTYLAAIQFLLPKRDFFLQNLA